MPFWKWSKNNFQCALGLVHYFFHWNLKEFIRDLFECEITQQEKISFYKETLAKSSSSPAIKTEMPKQNSLWAKLRLLSVTSVPFIVAYDLYIFLFFKQC